MDKKAHEEKVAAVGKAMAPHVAAYLNQVQIVVISSYILGAEKEDIANEMGLTRSAVYKIIQRSQPKLKIIYDRSSAVQDIIAHQYEIAAQERSSALAMVGSLLAALLGGAAVLGALVFVFTKLGAILFPNSEEEEAKARAHKLLPRQCSLSLAEGCSTRGVASEATCSWLVCKG